MTSEENQLHLRIIEEQRQNDTWANIRTITLYALSLAAAMGFNNLVTSLFDSFPYSEHIISKTTYVVILFGATIFASYWLSGIIPSSGQNTI